MHFLFEAEGIFFSLCYLRAIRSERGETIMASQRLFCVIYLWRPRPLV